ncbi:MAG: hypothetical protein A3G24_20665 [Betaproteobacteria bacterium RIFCSPLOWO2_12_FULL_62_13]|nr:MAG: hypothetical protein A3G24_20665 [Betaproteobacteria bacterium RIFCSPLOWO2_12_FULL_62_13]
MCLYWLILFLGFPVGSPPVQAYPTKPIRFIVPFPPGGGTDILARLIGQRLVEPLGVQVVVDNRPGAGTNIGMELAARAEPDGHTLLMASVGLAANPSLYRKMSFDPLRDLAPVTLVAVAPTILVSHPSLAAKTPGELVALAKSRPGQLNYGSFGSGSGGHLAAELFKLVTGVNIVHIPYKGGGPAITALLAGEVQLVFSSMLPVLAHVKAERLRPIGLAASKRAAEAPDVPTFREAGIPYETGTWFGVLVPMGTPASVVNRLHREITGILRIVEVRQRIAHGAEPIGNTPKEFASFVRSEADRWAKVVRTAGIKVD